jgi:hypothetical protein
VLDPGIAEAGQDEEVIIVRGVAHGVRRLLKGA